MTDAELLSRFVLEKSNTAFRQLVNRRLNLVYSVALRYVGGDVHCAQDVSQLVFIDLARKAKSLCQHEALLGWFYTSTRYAASKARRRELRHQQRAVAAAMLDRSEAPAPSDLERLRAVLDEVNLELNHRDRELVLARFFDESRLAVIGEKMGISENAAQKALDRALQKMRLLLTRRGITTTSAALSAAFCAQSATAVPDGLLESITTRVRTPASPANNGRSLQHILNSVKTHQVAVTGGLIGLGSILATALFFFDICPGKNIQAPAPDGSGERKPSTTASTISSEAAEPPVKIVARQRNNLVQIAAPASGLILAPNPANTAGDTGLTHLTELRQQGQIDRRYGALFRHLGLGPVQLATFRELLTEEEMARFDVHRIATERGIFPGKDPTGFRQLAAETIAPFENEIKSTIGDNGYTELETYRQTLAQRITAGQLEQALQGTAAYLTEQQTEQLVELFAERAPLPVAATNVPVGMFFEADGDGATLGTDQLAGSRITDAAVTRADTILSRPQIQALRDLQRKQQLQAWADRKTNGPFLSPK